MSDAKLLADRYRILKTLGSGGMGVVYLVEDTQVGGRTLALKTLKTVGNPQAENSFRAEFRNIRGVRHPNIPMVYDFGVLLEPERLLYFTCEYVEGSSLESLSGNWTALRLHQVLVELCRALAFLHSRGLLHRDVKPENVLARVNDAGELESIKLTDFGLAAYAAQEHELSGTLDYLAPEVIAGEKASVVSDLYALGVLLFRLATGRLPFEADGLTAAKQRVLSEAPSPLRIRPDLPVGLCDVISELLRLKPKERPASARQVIALLNQREGTDYPYETPASRIAYIHSAASVTHAQVRNRLSELKSAWQAGQPVPDVLILGAAGLGRTRLLRDFADELTLDGNEVRVAGVSDSKPIHEERAAVVIHDWRTAGESLEQVISKWRTGASWIILGGDDDSESSSTFSNVEGHKLHPLTAEDVKRFTDTTFPENSFPVDFYQDLHSQTLGFPSALLHGFAELIRLEILQIGLHGWQLLPTTWHIEPHPHVIQWVRRKRDALSAEAQEVLKTLVLSNTPLPEEILKDLTDSSDLKRERAFQELEATGWIHFHPEGAYLVTEVVREIIRSELPDAERRRRHARLRDLWEDPELNRHPAQSREILNHDWHARSFRLQPEKAQSILETALADGHSRWVRDLCQPALAEDVPAELQPVALAMMAGADYVEGDFESAAVHYSKLLDGQETRMTEDNLELFARYAMIEEKLGKSQHARELLSRCLEVLPPGQDIRAGIIFGTRAWIEFRSGDGERARRLAEEGLTRIPAGTVDAGYAMLLNTVATLAFHRGDMDAARMFWERGLEILMALKDRKGQATLYNNLGVLAAQSGDRLRARELWEHCAAIAREIGDVGRLAGIYNNLGIDSLESGALADAEENYLKSLALFRRMKSPREQVAILSNLGELAYYRADFLRAQAYWREAIDLSVALSDREAQLEPQVYLAKLNVLLNNSEQAEMLLNQTWQLAHEIGSSKAELQALEALASVQALRGDFESADQLLFQAHALLSEECDPLAHVHLHLTESEVAALHHDEERAHQAWLEARKAAETKWDPYAAARMSMSGLLFANLKMDGQERARSLRQFSVYPEIMWRIHWGLARQHVAEGAAQKALDEFGRAVAVLKGISSRLSDEMRQRYLNSPAIRTFKIEALHAKQKAKEVQHG